MHYSQIKNTVMRTFEIEGVTFRMPPLKDINWRINFRAEEQRRIGRHGVIPIICAVRANLNAYRQSGNLVDLSAETKERLLNIIGC